MQCKHLYWLKHQRKFYGFTLRSQSFSFINYFYISCVELYSKYHYIKYRNWNLNYVLNSLHCFVWKNKLVCFVFMQSDFAFEAISKRYSGRITSTVYFDGYVRFHKSLQVILTKATKYREVLKWQSYLCKQIDENYYINSKQRIKIGFIFWDNIPIISFRLFYKPANEWIFLSAWKIQY